MLPVNTLSSWIVNELFQSDLWELKKKKRRQAYLHPLNPPPTSLVYWSHSCRHPVLSTDHVFLSVLGWLSADSQHLQLSPLFPPPPASCPQPLRRPLVTGPCCGHGWKTDQKCQKWTPPAHAPSLFRRITLSTCFPLSSRFPSRILPHLPVVITFLITCPQLAARLLLTIFLLFLEFPGKLPKQTACTLILVSDCSRGAHQETPLIVYLILVHLGPLFYFILPLR